MSPILVPQAKVPKFKESKGSAQFMEEWLWSQVRVTYFLF